MILYIRGTKWSIQMSTDSFYGVIKSWLIRYMGNGVYGARIEPGIETRVQNQLVKKLKWKDRSE